MAGPVPTLVVLDVKVPKIDGIEILRDIKTNAQTRAIPVVMLTSSAQERDRVESYQLGVNSYLVKPIQYEAFIEAVAGLGAYWSRINEPPPG